MSGWEGDGGNTEKVQGAVGRDYISNGCERWEIIIMYCVQKPKILYSIFRHEKNN